jgi:hypothetical protein
MITSGSGSVSEGSNPSPAAPQKPRFAGLFLLVVFHRPRWTRLDPSGVMVTVMVKLWSSSGADAAEMVDDLVLYWRMRRRLALCEWASRNLWS